jgi:hypothetical protein
MHVFGVFNIKRVKFYAMGNSTFLDIVDVTKDIVCHKQIEKRGSRIFMRMKKRPALVSC